MSELRQIIKLIKYLHKKLVVFFSLVFSCFTKAVYETLVSDTYYFHIFFHLEDYRKTMITFACGIVLDTTYTPIRMPNRVNSLREENKG